MKRGFDDDDNNNTSPSLISLWGDFEHVLHMHFLPLLDIHMLHAMRLVDKMHHAIIHRFAVDIGSPFFEWCCELPEPECTCCKLLTSLCLQRRGDDGLPCHPPYQDYNVIPFPIEWSVVLQNIPKIVPKIEKALILHLREKRNIPSVRPLSVCPGYYDPTVDLGSSTGAMFRVYLDDKEEVIVAREDYDVYNGSKEEQDAVESSHVRHLNGLEDFYISGISISCTLSQFICQLQDSHILNIEALPWINDNDINVTRSIIECYCTGFNPPFK